MILYHFQGLKRWKATNHHHHWILFNGEIAWMDLGFLTEKAAQDALDALDKGKELHRDLGDVDVLQLYLLPNVY